MIRPPGFWQAIRYAYENEATSVRQIAERFSVDVSTLRQRAKKEAWVRRNPPNPAIPASAKSPPPSPPTPLPIPALDDSSPALVAALRRTVARLTLAMEARYAGPDIGPVEEKDFKALGALAAMLARVIALDNPRSARDEDADAAGPDSAVDFDDPRQRETFALRLERLAAGDPR